MQICASLNHRKKMEAEPNRLIPLKPTDNLLELLINRRDVSFHDNTFLRLVQQTASRRLSPFVSTVQVRLQNQCESSASNNAQIFTLIRTARYTVWQSLSVSLVHSSS